MFQAIPKSVTSITNYGSRLRSVGLALLFSLGFSGDIRVFAGEPCFDAIEASLLAEDRARPIKPWSVDKKDLQLSPEDLLPRGFVEQLKKSVGPLELNYSFNENSGRNSGFGFYIGAGNKTVAKFYCRFVEGDRYSIELHDLELTNPLNEGENKHFGQQGKGLPLPVFLYAKDRLLEVLKAGGYRTLVAHGISSYAVSTLYRRMIKMEPDGPKAERFMKYLDSVYSYATKELPRDVRMKSLDDFSRAIGEPIPYKVENAWKLYSETGKVSAGMELVVEKNGNVIAMIDRSNPSEARVYFPLQPPSEGDLLWWQPWRSSESLYLTRSLIPVFSLPSEK